MKTLFYIVVWSFMLSSCSQATEAHFNKEDSVPTEVTFHKTHEPKKENAPFSDIVQVGNLYFLSGQIGMNHTERVLVEGGITIETKQTLENIKAVLAQHDMDMSNVVKALVILDNIDDFQAFNKVYKTYFPQKPARTTFAAEALAAGALIEIEVVAVK
ncbi:RidA family protein [Dokdonia sinensis]|uniref:RidA family protein n=1 Tax=Dokdonia sinensis TaxID=2479847 RepID=A0A3M0G7U7_9FLAO|nr:RidA family protein [Dokdonia sinensis]RMB61100.1 RidA family protein [Dokdonia sinensis]